MARTVRRATATKADTAPSTKSEYGNKLASVPAKQYLDTYINRKIGNVRDFDAFDTALSLKHNVLIEGPTGTGKTSAIMAYAAYKQMPFYSVSSSNGTEPTQLFGKFIVDEATGGFAWQDGPVTDIVRHGGILLINEINFIPERVLSVLFGLLDKRRKIELVDHKGEVIYAPDNFIVFADMNPGYQGTRELNHALRNRFATKLIFDYDAHIETKLVKSKALRSLAKQLRDQIAQGLYDTPVSTNMLVEFEQLVAGIDLDYAVNNFINAFDHDDRASIREVFKTWNANLDSDFKASAKKKDGATATDTAKTDDEYDYESEFYSEDDLIGLTLTDLIDYAVAWGWTIEKASTASIDELKAYLTGNHDEWKAS
jgi:nitric oxide reductase NorQ protein